MVVLTIGACDRPTDVAWTGSIADSAGVRIVSNPSSGLWSDADQPTVRVVMQTASAADDPERELRNIIALAVRDDGRLLILDAGARRVAEYSPDGVWLRNLSGPGSGPGELSNGVDGLWVGAADTVFIADIGAQRITILDSTGSAAGTIPLPFGRGIAHDWRTDRRGRTVHGLALFDGDPTQRLAIVVRGRDGDIQDTLVRLPLADALSRGPEGPTLTILGAETAWDLGEDGSLVHGMTDTPSLMRTDSTGRPIMRITWPFTPLVVPADRQEQILEAYIGLWQRRLPPQQWPTLRQNARFAEQRPLYGVVRFGPGGTLWVQRLMLPDDLATGDASFDPDRDLGADMWDVFGADGRYLGPLELPRRFAPLLARGTRFYGVARDSLGFQSVMAVTIDGL
jgi:hypothetical protein